MNPLDHHALSSAQQEWNQLVTKYEEGGGQKQSEKLAQQRHTVLLRLESLLHQHWPVSCTPDLYWPSATWLSGEFEACALAKLEGCARQDLEDAYSLFLKALTYHDQNITCSVTEDGEKMVSHAQTRRRWDLVARLLDIDYRLWPPHAGLTTPLTPDERQRLDKLSEDYATFVDGKCSKQLQKLNYSRAAALRGRMHAFGILWASYVRQLLETPDGALPYDALANFVGDSRHDANAVRTFAFRFEAQLQRGQQLLQAVGEADLSHWDKDNPNLASLFACLALRDRSDGQQRLLPSLLLYKQECTKLSSGRKVSS